MNTVEIKIDTTDQTMIGGGSWENCDPQASVAKFLQQVYEEVKRYWPGYEITIEETSHKNEVYITDEREYGAEIEEDQAAIHEAIQSVWSRGDWYME